MEQPNRDKTQPTKEVSILGFDIEVHSLTIYEFRNHSSIFVIVLDCCLDTISYR